MRLLEFKGWIRKPVFHFPERQVIFILKFTIPTPGAVYHSCLESCNIPLA